mmetsp:Transcript_18406/g.21278  ORF Transcript_18406/g.21278 Transcript_18406/m.21278 type:complete len:238 (+) Transcript_18406:30-743(+)
MIFVKTISSAIILSTISAALGRSLQSTLLPFPSEIATKFRQGFRVENGKEFTEDEIELIESIYVANTINFAPNNEVESVTTNCTVFRQDIIVLPEDDELDTESVLSVDYVMTFDSKYYSVENYTRMFQNWTNLNLETIQEQMNLLSINVTEVDKASRIVVTTPSPTTTPDSTQTQNKNEMMDDADNTEDSSSAPVTSTTAPTVLSPKNEDSSSAPFPCFIKLLYQAIIGLCVALTPF